MQCKNGHDCDEVFKRTKKLVLENFWINGSSTMGYGGFLSLNSEDSVENIVRSISRAVVGKKFTRGSCRGVPGSCEHTVQEALGKDARVLAAAAAKLADMKKERIDSELFSIHEVIVRALQAGRSPDEIQAIVDRALVESVTKE